MNRDPRVDQMLEQILDSDCIPEEACHDCPELLGEVRQSLREIRSVEAQVDALFPPSHGRRSGQVSNKLPEIPGYTVEVILGRGGVGVVYKARHLKLGRPVAIKMLLSGAHASPPELMRFMREAQAIATLVHANIVQVHDVGELDGQPYYTMEFVEGGSLAQRLAGVPQPADQAAALVATLAEAIHTAHQGGIVHRDLKPGNVLLTLDGTPKISDFGLARYFDYDGSLTITGFRAGTPSYMAPEQAAGKTSAIGPPSDVYSLGAILYEMLTGRPPFQGESTAETERQLLTQEPVPPSRLNPRVPRDLQTICLKCLNKDPLRRYPTAAALAEDIHRFQRGEPITARPTGIVERVAKWARRQPVHAAVLVGGILVITAVTAGVLWFAADRAASIRAVESDLKEVNEAEGRLDWVDASAALGRARARLANRPIDYLRSAVDQDTRELQLAQLLDSTELSRFAIVEGRFYRRFDKEHADVAYANAFRDAGYGSFDDAPELVAERIGNSHIKAALIALLDDWSLCVTDPQQQQWLFNVARSVDHDPTGWRDRARDPTVYSDRVALSKLAESVSSAKAPVQFLVVLGARLRNVGVDTTPYLRQVLLEYPSDFWVNTTLGDAVRLGGNPADSLRYYQAALAVRPNSAVAYGNLGVALGADKQPDDAIAAFRAAIQIDPNFSEGHYSLGLVLRREGRTDDAIAEFKEAIRIAPDVADFYYNLGLAFGDSGRLDDAIDNFHKALRIDPNNPATHYALGLTLRKGGHADEAIAEFKEAIGIIPGVADYHYNLALALNDTGKTDAAIESFRAALRINPNNPNTHFILSLALRKDGLTDEAIAELQEAIRIAPDVSEYHYILALAFLDSGKANQAIESLRTALRIDPKNANTHYVLALELRKEGRADEAITEFNEAIRIAPDIADYHYNLALALNDSGKIDGAIETFRAAIRIDPKNPNAHYILGLALRSKGHTDEAIGEFREAIRIAPDNPDYHYLLALALTETGKPDEAMDSFRTALRLDPNNANAHYMLGMALRVRGHPDEAIVEFKQAIRVAPDTPDYHYNLALALGETGKAEEAIDSFRTAIRLDPKNADALYNLGVALKGKGEFQEAIDPLQKATELQPGSAYAHYNLALALSATNKKTEALAQLEDVLKIDRKQPHVQYVFAGILRDTGHIDQSIEHFQDAISLDPNDALAYGEMGESFLQTGNPSRAQTALQRCVELLPPNHARRAEFVDALHQCDSRLAKQRGSPTSAPGADQVRVQVHN
jgi:tetratricopeptide (TPR) repeat protein